MVEKGQIIELKNEYAIVKIMRTDACSKCGVCKTGNNKNEMLIEAKNLCNANLGDWVNIDLQPQNFLKAIFIMYVIPLITLMAGFILGNIYNEAFGFILGLIFMLFTYLWIKHKEAYWKQQNFVPIIIEKL